MHTYTRPHTHIHTCMTSPVNQKLKTLSTSAWTRCGFQVAGWLPTSAEELFAASHVCVCVCVSSCCAVCRLKVCAAYALCQFRRTKKNCRQVKSKHRASFDSPSLSCLPHFVLCCVVLATTFDLCSKADITWPGLNWDSRRILRVRAAGDDAGKLICTSCY